MPDGDDVVLGQNNVAMSSTEISLGLNSNASPVLKVSDIHTATCIYGVSVDVAPVGGGGTGVRGDSAWGLGVHGKSGSASGVLGESVTGLGVEGRSDAVGVQGKSDPGDGVRGISKSGRGVVGKSDGTHGVFGESKNGNGVAGFARHKDRNGVYGTNQDGRGVAGASVFGAGVYGVATSGTGVYGKATQPNGYGGRFDGQVTVNGAFTVNGLKSAAVPFPDGSYHLMYCQESPEPWFEDFGESVLVKGRAEVKIEPEFAKTIDLTKPYHVFVTPHDANTRGMAVTQRRADHFVVEAQKDSADGTFSYRVVGRRRDAVAVRLARFEIPAPLPEPEFTPEDDDARSS